MNRQTHINMVMSILGLQDDRHTGAQSYSVKVVDDYDTWFHTSRKILLRSFNWSFCVDPYDVTPLDPNDMTDVEKKYINNLYGKLYRLPDNVIGLADTFSSQGDLSIGEFDTGGSYQGPNSPSKFRHIDGKNYLSTSDFLSSVELIQDVKKYEDFSPEFAQLLAYEVAIAIAPTVRSSRETRTIIGQKQIIASQAHYIAGFDTINRRMN